MWCIRVAILKTMRYLMGQPVQLCASATVFHVCRMEAEKVHLLKLVHIRMTTAALVNDDWANVFEVMSLPC